MNSVAVEQPNSARHRRWTLATSVGLGAIAALLAYRPIFAVDTFWHLALGSIIDNTGIPFTDCFSAVHPDKPWVQFQWLWEWIAFRLVDGGGLQSLRLANAVVFGCALALVFRAVRAHASYGMALFLTALFLALCVDRMRVRPDALNVFFFAVGLPFVLGGWKQLGWKAYGIPLVLGCLWSNFHGGGSLLWVVMLGTIPASSILSNFARGKGPFLRNLAFPALGLLGSLLNPTLAEGLQHFLGIYHEATTRIPNPEWDPTYSMLFLADHPNLFLVGLAPYLLLLPFTWLMIRTFRRRVIDADTIQFFLLAAGTLYISHHWVRTVFLCIIAGLALSKFRHPLLNKGAISAAILILCSTFHYGTIHARGSLSNALHYMHHDLEPTVYPTHAADFIEKAGIRGNVFNEGKWGGYLIWRGYPQIRVFFDTRHNLTPRMWDILLEGLSLPRRTNAMQASFHEFGTELAVVKHGAEPFDAPPVGWELLYKAGPEVIYQHKNGLNSTENLAKARAFLKGKSARDFGGNRWLNEKWRANRILEDQNTHEGRLRNARRLYRADQYDRAADAFDACLGSAEFDPVVSLWASAAHYRSGDLQAARLRYQAGIVALRKAPLLLQRDLSALEL